MKRPLIINEAYEEEPIDLSRMPRDRTLIFASCDPALRTFTWDILLAPALDSEGLGIFFSFKKDLFDGQQMGAGHKYSAHDCMKRTRFFLKGKGSLFEDFDLLTIETQMNEYANPNSSAIMQVMGVTFSTGDALGVQTHLISPLSTANYFPYIFVQSVPPHFMPNEKDAKRRRHDWNKQCVIDVVDSILTNAERRQIEDWNEDMWIVAKTNGYKAFKKNIDDYLDPKTDNARMYLECKRLNKIENNEDLLKTRIHYLSKGYAVRYAVMATYCDSTFPQKWHVDHNKKIWYCMIKLCNSSTLASMMLEHFNFDLYLSDYENNHWGGKSWITHPHEDWESLLSLFQKKK